MWEGWVRDGDDFGGQGLLARGDQKDGLDGWEK